MRFFLQLVFLLATVSLQAKTKQADLVVFSYDRPMQLYACLESVEKYIIGLEKQHVIYRTSSEAFDKAYRVVEARFPNVIFHKQSKVEPHVDFKKFVLFSVYSKLSSAEYVLFGVDDIIVKDTVDIEPCVKAMQKEEAWGFFLRLGKNITHTFSHGRDTPVPPGTTTKEQYFVWEFHQGQGDWCYPNTVDMTLYNKEKINKYLKTTDYTNPYFLEDKWAQVADYQKKGICSLQSKVINIPVNQVGAFANRCLNTYTPQELLKLFEQGLKIDIKAFYRIENRSAHADVPLSFIPRMPF